MRLQTEAFFGLNLLDAHVASDAYSSAPAERRAAVRRRRQMSKQTKS